MNLQKSMTDYYVGLLNTLTQAQEYDFVFRTGYLVQQTNLTFQYDEEIDTGIYATKTYVPVMVESVDRPRGVPNQDVSEWTLNMQFMLVGEHTDDPYLQKQLNILESFRRHLITYPSKVFNVELLSGTEAFTAHALPSAVNRAGGAGKLNSMTVTPVTMQLYLTTTQDLGLGKVEVQFKNPTDPDTAWETISAIDFSISGQKALESEQEFGEAQATSVAMNRMTNFSIRAHVDTASTMTADFIQDLSAQRDLGVYYNMRYKYPITASYIYVNVILESGSVVITHGALDAIDLQFKVAYGV